MQVRAWTDPGRAGFAVQGRQSAVMSGSAQRSRAVPAELPAPRAGKFVLGEGPFYRQICTEWSTRAQRRATCTRAVSAASGSRAPLRSE